MVPVLECVQVLGASVYESAGFSVDETSANAFSSPTYAGAWYAYDLVRQGMSGGSSMEDRYAPSISAGGEMDGIAFGPGPNSASTPSPTDGPFASQDQNSQQQQGLFVPHTPGPSQRANQSQSTSVFSPPFSNSVAFSPLQYPYGGSSPSPGSVPSPSHEASHPSNVGSGLAQRYITSRMTLIATPPVHHLLVLGWADRRTSGRQENSNYAYLSFPPFILLFF
ncbi:hypothetical protein ACEPAI_10089 [Sanghuangporus weigelae]